jgi:hypothetical protein
MGSIPYFQGEEGPLEIKSDLLTHLTISNGSTMEIICMEMPDACPWKWFLSVFGNTFADRILYFIEISWK